jgi:glycosyltransferase involved in cell wall biosynthesis
MNKTLRVSVVIPARNEEETLSACLEALSRQSVKPYEVIVVDNNSTDATAAIASRYDFVTLLHEPLPGIAHARDRGFNHSRGDVIGRIDADTILTDDWIEKVQVLFADADISAVTGSLHYYDAPLTSIIDAVDLACRKWLNAHQGDYVYLLGGNMAIRRSAWKKTQSLLCHRQSFHEDEDLAIHLGKIGLTAKLIPELKAGVSGRCIDVSPKDFLVYVYANIRTYSEHRVLRRRAMYPVMTIVLFFYLPLRFLYRGYDVSSRRFRWRKALGKSRNISSRVNPVLFVEPGVSEQISGRL